MAENISKDVFNWLLHSAIPLLDNDAANASMNVEEFLDEFAGQKTILERHIEEYKETKLPLDETILEHAFQLAKGICSTDLNSFTSLSQEMFAAQLELGAGTDPRVAEIAESIRNSDMKIISNIRSSRVNLLRFGEKKECTCPVENKYVNSVCLARAAMHFIRAVLNFYHMTKGTQTVFRPEGKASLKKYLHRLDQCLERLLELGQKEISPECLMLKAEKVSNRSSPKKQDDPRQPKITSYFNTPPPTPQRPGGRVLQPTDMNEVVGRPQVPFIY